MGIFGGKKSKVVDFSENYHAARKFAQRSQQSSQNTSSDSYPDMGFLGSVASSSASNATTDNFAWDNEPSQPSTSETVGDYSEKKQKLAKRLLDMTNKIEDLSNQIYHLMQRVELLEKKSKLSYN
jgi:hypothetical protein